MKAWLWILGVLWLSACNTKEAPERTCGAHHECDANFLCAPQGICVPAMVCDSDETCCGGADCFSGWCRPTEECDALKTCAGIGEVCEANRCVPAPCGNEGQCAGTAECVAGRCIRGEPCGGRCGPEQACDLREQRCVATANACSCESGWAIAQETPLSPISCEAASCECASLASIPKPHPGIDGALVALENSFALISYEPIYGDVLVSRFDPSPLAQSNRGALHDHQDTVLLGLPTQAHHPVARPDSFRGGIREAGPNLGERLSLHATSLGDTAEVDLLYRDRAENQLRYTRITLDAQGFETSADFALPISGLDPTHRESGSIRGGGADLGLGRSQCLVRMPNGHLRGLVFVPADSTGSHALLMRFESTTATPRYPTDISFNEVLSHPLPRRTEAPCQNDCAFGELCIAHASTGQAQCAPVLSTLALGPAPEVCAECAAREVCVELDGTWGCHPKLERLQALDRLPAGEGMYLSCTLDAQGDFIAAWYDAEHARLQAGKWPFDSASRLTVDEQNGRDVGRFAAIAARSGEVAIAYQDATSGALRFARAPQVLGPYRTEEVPAEWGDYGAWTKLKPFEGGWVVATSEARQADIVLFVHRDEGCWANLQAHSVGGFAYADLVVMPGERAWVSTRSLRYDAQLRPQHEPIIAKLPLPTCQP